MADASAIAACKTKYEALTAANFPSSTRPPFFFDEAPAKHAGSQLRPPYVVLKDNGMTPGYEFERKVFEVTEATFEIFAETLADVDTIANVIRYNGGAVDAGSGFDFGTFSGLASGLTTHEIKREREQRFVGGERETGAIVHGCQLSYRITLLRQ